MPHTFARTLVIYTGSHECYTRNESMYESEPPCSLYPGANCLCLKQAERGLNACTGIETQTLGVVGLEIRSDGSQSTVGPVNI